MTTRYAKLYHVTTPEVAQIILREGFRDHAAQKGAPGFGVTHTFDPGVWFADVPPITAIGVDQYMGMLDNAWVAIIITATDFECHFRGSEWQDESWPTRQWMIPAMIANRFSRIEIPLEQVLRKRINNDLTADELRELIESEVTDDTIKARWLAALPQSAEGKHAALNSFQNELAQSTL